MGRAEGSLEEGPHAALTAGWEGSQGFPLSSEVGGHRLGAFLPLHPMPACLRPCLSVSPGVSLAGSSGPWLGRWVWLELCGFWPASLMRPIAGASVYPPWVRLDGRSPLPVRPQQSCSVTVEEALPAGPAQLGPLGDQAELWGSGWGCLTRARGLADAH